MKICVPSKTKDVSVKVFDMITRICEAKNANSIVQHVIQIKNGIMINVNVSVKSNAHAKKIIVGILTYLFKRIVGI